MNVKNILLFVGGLAIGAASGILGTKKYFEDRYQKRYEEDHDALEEYYHKRDEYTRDDHEEAEEEFEDDGVNPVETDSVPGGRMSPEERAEIKAKLNRNWEGTTNYAGMYREKNGYTERALAEGTAHPLDVGEPGEEDPDDQNQEEVESAEETAFNEHQKNKDRPPKIISADAFSELDAHIETEVLYFYALDEMLCDENEEPIEEPERLVGDCLDKYGFRDNDERLIFVMNYALDTAYEIQKVDSSWTDTH